MADSQPLPVWQSFLDNSGGLWDPGGWQLASVFYEPLSKWPSALAQTWIFINLQNTTHPTLVTP